MSATIILVFAVFFALAIGIFIGKQLFQSSSKTRISVLEKQLELNEKEHLNAKSQLVTLQLEKEELTILLAKKENTHFNMYNSTFLYLFENHELSNKFKKTKLNYISI